MSAPLEENVAQIKAMGMALDDQQIREALKNCNNNMDEAMQLLIPESPEDANLISTYNIVAKQTSSSSYEGDMDMGDTETHPGSGGESDRDSTTVSYSLEEERTIDVEEEVGPPSLQFQDSHEESGELSEYPPRPDGPPPRYEDIVTSNQGDSISPLPDDPAQEVLEAQATSITENGAQSSSFEFPLTHFYELESRVHTDQWSIPYKREESLAICMVATTKMIREGECVCGCECVGVWGCGCDVHYYISRCWFS